MYKRNIIIIMLNVVFALTATAQVPIPPAKWQEHWFEHVQKLSLVFYDNDVAVYFDSETPTSITWMNQYCGDMWRYCKQVYGDMDGGGSDQRLWAIFHTNKYSGGHPSYYYDASHDYRNVEDIGPGPWLSNTGWNLDATTHEVCHIVESTPHGLKTSPAFNIWGDSKWGEIFIYDVYNGLGLTAERDRWYNQVINNTDNFPQAGTQWFKNWFYPIWSNYGGSACLNKFLQLLGQYIPDRDMNMGEFIHFWSGAAGVNLKGRAKTAFGWQSDWSTEFDQAKIDFPNVTYGSTGVETEQDAAGGIVPRSPELNQNYPNPFNPSTNINYRLFAPGEVSLKIYDALGREAATLVEGFKESGYHSAIWKTENLSSGVYFCVLKVQQNNGKSFLQTKGMLLAK